jgi:hypothetical protein
MPGAVWGGMIGDKGNQGCGVRHVQLPQGGGGLLQCISAHGILFLATEGQSQPCGHLGLYELRKQRPFQRPALASAGEPHLAPYSTVSEFGIPNIVCLLPQAGHNRAAGQVPASVPLGAHAGRLDRAALRGRLWADARAAGARGGGVRGGLARQRAQHADAPGGRCVLPAGPARFSKAPVASLGRWLMSCKYCKAVLQNATAQHMSERPNTPVPCEMRLVLQAGTVTGTAIGTAGCGFLDTVVRLVELGADVNARDITDCTPLQNAAHGTYSALAAVPSNTPAAGGEPGAGVGACLCGLGRRGLPSGPLGGGPCRVAPLGAGGLLCAGLGGGACLVVPWAKDMLGGLAAKGSTTWAGPLWCGRDGEVAKRGSGG